LIKILKNKGGWGQVFTLAISNDGSKRDSCRVREENYSGRLGLKDLFLQKGTAKAVGEWGCPCGKVQII
jgi:hypothetical protein